MVIELVINYSLNNMNNVVFLASDVHATDLL